MTFWNEKHRKIVAALQEWEVLQGEPTYEQAIWQLANYLSIAYPENQYRCAFGEYALCSVGYGMLTKEELEFCRKLLSQKRCGGKKVKLWARAVASTNYYGREFVSVTLPNLVLWEVSGVSYADAQEFAKEISALVGLELQVLPRM